MIRLGTRGSALALAQARWVAEQIPQPTELVVISTPGDRGAGEQDKSRWVSALEQALLDDRIDVAVHSAKDVPAQLAGELELVAIPRRADARDAICGAASLGALPPGARVGTSSLRRAAQILALRDDLQVLAVRGNVDTRLAKLAAGEYDALVLAAAGLARLGLAADGLLEELVPAAGQGALALEARAAGSGSDAVRDLMDAEADACVMAERALTAALGADCNTPVGAHAVPTGDGSLELRAWVGRPDGSAWVDDRLTGPPEQVGRACAERLLAAGAGELL